MSAPDPLEIGKAVLERFSRQNQERKEQGEALRAAIREIEEAHPGPVPLRAEAVRAMLDPQKLGRPRPSLRTVQRYLSRNSRHASV